MAGLLIAGVPGALLLGFLTFVASMMPVGPPLNWGGAAVWLFFSGVDRLGYFYGGMGLLYHQRHR
jgi:predicted PurR-regulated permease PerM